MFGYIKIQKEELLLKDYNLYRALYCGLCREIRKNISLFLPFSLSYDFVFLAIARDIIKENSPKTESGRCPYNPLKKKSFVISDGVKFASLSALVLVEKNLEDKRRDKDYPLLSPFVALAHTYLKGKVRRLSKNADFNTLYSEVSKKLDAFSQLEKNNASIDELCESFGGVMSAVISAGLDGQDKRIAEALGMSIGAWLYLADAVDDAEKDCKKGHFNPLIEEYKTVEEVKKRAREIDVTLASHAKNAHLALGFYQNGAYSRIAENIITKGLGLEAWRLFTKDGGNNDRSI